jgi:hypothetical protein
MLSAGESWRTRGLLCFSRRGYPSTTRQIVITVSVSFTLSAGSSERLRVRDLFLNAITDSRLVSVCTGVDENTFWKAQTSRSILDRSGVNHPWYLGFLHSFQALFMMQTLLNVIPEDPEATEPDFSNPTRHRMGFIVDENHLR